eukprot:6486385-Amphidinium_carterae.2
MVVDTLLRKAWPGNCESGYGKVTEFAQRGRPHVRSCTGSVWPLSSKRKGDRCQAHHQNGIMRGKSSNEGTSHRVAYSPWRLNPAHEKYISSSEGSNSMPE